LGSQLFQDFNRGDEAGDRLARTKTKLPNQIAVDGRKMTDFFIDED
jgi:hypothetical protein